MMNCRLCGAKPVVQGNTCVDCFKIFSLMEEPSTDLNVKTKGDYTYYTRGGYTYIEPLEKGENMSEEMSDLTPEAQEKLDGSPAHIVEDFVDIKFQMGPIKEHGVNGTTVERILDLVVARIEGFQAGPFKCRENAIALTKIQEAQHWLQHRTAKRQVRGVEGTNRV